ncbi:MAG: S9 family peptidase, partial [Acidobacteriaceae bacterium]
MTLARSLLLPFALGAALASAAQTPPVNPPHDPRVTQLIDALGQGKNISETNLSPDGNWIVWGIGGRGGSDIEVAPLANPESARPITACSAGARGAESEAVFSPDSKQIA